jgi:hypothetical protein
MEILIREGKEIFMKRIILAAIIALTVAGIGFAHGHHENGHGGPARNCYVNGGHYHNGVFFNGHH